MQKVKKQYAYLFSSFSAHLSVFLHFLMSNSDPSALVSPNNPSIIVCQYSLSENHEDTVFSRTTVDQNSASQEISELSLLLMYPSSC